jgi:hypothetical protein
MRAVVISRARPGTCNLSDSALCGTYESAGDVEDAQPPPFEFIARGRIGQSEALTDPVAAAHLHSVVVRECCG